MTHRHKILLTTGASIALLSLVVFVFSRSILTTGFAKVEEDLARVNIERVKAAYDLELENLDAKLSDWANWDDTYTFIVDRNKDYVDANLQDTALSLLKLNFMVFLGADGGVVAVKSVDLKKGSSMELPASLLAAIATGSALTRHKDTTSHIATTLLLPEGPLMIASQPILTSNAEGPTRGTLMFARFIDDEIMQRIMMVSRVNASIKSAREVISDPGYQRVLQSSALISIDAVSDDKLVGYMPVAGVDGKLAFLFRVETPRDIRKYSRESTAYLVLGVIGVSLFFSVAALLLQELYTVRPVLRLINEVKKIGMSRNPKLRLESAKGMDELGILRAELNRMLSSLDASQTELAERSRELEQTHTDMRKKVADMERNNADLENTKKAMLNLLEDARSLEEDLRQERDRVNAIVASMSEGLFVVDQDYRVTFMNRKARDFFGFSDSEVNGKKLSEITTLFRQGAELSESDRPLYKTLRTGEAVVGGVDDGFALGGAGRSVPVGFSTAALKNGDTVVGALVTFRDITHEKQEKETIERTVRERTSELEEKNKILEETKRQVSEGWLQQQREKARLASSIYSLSRGFILTDADERVILINPAATRILGLDGAVHSLSDIEGQLKDLCDLHALHTKARNEKHQEEVKSVFYRDRYVHLYVTPIIASTDHEEFIGTVVMVEDITDEKVLERSRDEFFSIASHELRTPLTAIRGNASMIEEYYKDQIKDRGLQEMIADIHASSVRLIEIVNDFLDTSRLELGKMEFKKTAFNVSDPVSEVIKDLSVNAGQKGIKLELHVGEQLTVMADRDKVKQILFNLLGNSIKFTETGGVSVTLAKQDRFAEVSISDTGRGISTENQSLLFRKFQQAEENIMTRDATRGTGLGLYISKLLVEGMGGKIRLARSEPGKGSTFAFTLPLSA